MSHAPKLIVNVGSGEVGQALLTPEEVADRQALTEAAERAQRRADAHATQRAALEEATRRDLLERARSARSLDDVRTALAALAEHLIGGATA
jgi:hypothetical protein